MPSVGLWLPCCCYYCHRTSTCCCLTWSGVKHSLRACLVLSCVWLFVTLWTVAHRAPLPWDFPGKNTGVCCHFLLQRIFPTQGLNRVSWGSCIGRRILYHWATWEAKGILGIVLLDPLISMSSPSIILVCYSHMLLSVLLIFLAPKKLTEKAMAPHSSTLACKIPWTEEPGGLQSMGSLGVRHDWATSLSLFTFMEKEMATHSSVLAWRIPGMGEPGGLPSMGSHRVGHDWCDLAAAAARSSHVSVWLTYSFSHMVFILKLF